MFSFLFTQRALPLLATLLLLTSPVAATTDSLVIYNATLISGFDPEPKQDTWVEISNGEIVAIGNGRPNHNAKHTIDAQGRFLIPGLIDSHVHLYHATGLKRKYSSNFGQLRKAFMDQQPRSFLYFGFTTVVELNADMGTNRRFENAPLHPRLFHCGQGVVLSDGFMALEVEGELGDAYPGYLIDHHAKGISASEVDPAHTPAAVIDTIVDAGGTCVKVYFEEALWWPGERPDFALPSTEIVSELIGIAHAHELPVLLHATTPRGHAFGLDVGVDLLVHGMWEWPGQAFDDPEPKLEYRKIANAISEKGTWIQPTFTTVRNASSLFDPRSLDDPNWHHVVPSEYLEYLRTDAQAQRNDFVRMFKPSFPAGTTVEEIPKLQAAFQKRYSRLIVEMIEQGAKLTFGTDTAVGGFGWAAPPGLAGYWEIRHWADAGVPLATLFEALTINNAIALSLHDSIGSVDTGKRADLLLLRDDPLRSASAYDSIEILIVDGTIVERDQLSAR